MTIATTIVHFGKVTTIPDLARKEGIPEATLRTRYKKGHRDEKLVQAEKHSRWDAIPCAPRPQRIPSAFREWVRGRAA